MMLLNVTACMFIAYLLFRLYHRFLTVHGRLPGPISWPVVGCLFEFLQSGSYQTFLLRLHKDYGDVVSISFPGVKVISVANAELSRQAVKSSTQRSASLRVGVLSFFRSLGLL
jgi:hypothetical protein